MIKAVYVNELGSGDAVTHAQACDIYAEAYAISPPRNRAGDTPLVHYKMENGPWKVACYRDEEKNTPSQSWRDWDAIYKEGIR